MPVKKAWQEEGNMGIALIVLSWTLFTSLGWSLWVSIVCTIVGSFIALFGFLFFIYFFNIDMKLTSSLEPLLLKIYEKKKRNRKI